MKGTGLLTWKDYKHRDPENQYPCVKVDMRLRTKEEWKQVVKLARQNGIKNVYDTNYQREQP